MSQVLSRRTILEHIAYCELSLEAACHAKFGGSHLVRGGYVKLPLDTDNIFR